MNINELRERASKAFDAEFRDNLYNAVQKHILNGGLVTTAWLNNLCKCPEGCLMEGNSYPSFGDMYDLFGFSFSHHLDFQAAFDRNVDNGTPESALGLLYRLRFIK